LKFSRRPIGAGVNTKNLLRQSRRISEFALWSVPARLVTFPGGDLGPNQ